MDMLGSNSVGLIGCGIHLLKRPKGIVIGGSSQLSSVLTVLNQFDGTSVLIIIFFKGSNSSYFSSSMPSDAEPLIEDRFLHRMLFRTQLSPLLISLLTFPPLHFRQWRLIQETPTVYYHQKLIVLAFLLFKGMYLHQCEDLSGFCVLTA